MLSMVQEGGLVVGLATDVDGVVLVDGALLGGVGVAMSGVDLALDPGALTTNVVRAASANLLYPY